ncbi:hypothetical protein J5500_02295 [Candidatus Saccharibacteria bacterium]|nr:hypothetical protein [Candidatus Saccharibacteria bacterium]
MKDMQFDHGVKYTEEAIGIFSQAKEKKLKLETCAKALAVLGRPTIEMLMHSASEVEVDGKKIDVLCDNTDDPDFKVPEAAALETVRRLRAMNYLTKKEALAHAVEVDPGELVSILLGDVLSTPLDKLCERLVLAEMMIDLFDRWFEVDMDHFGRALRLPLQFGMKAVDSVIESIEGWEANDGDLPEDAAATLDHAYDLDCEMQERVDAFLEAYPDMAESFEDDEDDDDDEDEGDDEEDDWSF